MAQRGPGQRPSRAASCAGVFLLAAACQDPAPISFALDKAAFGAGNLAFKGDAFTLVASDADLDGDEDLLVNWHVFAAPALWWNEGGGFRLRNEKVPWSLPEHPAAPLLDAAKQPILRSIAAREQAGVYLWHSDKGTFWNFLVRLPEASDPTARLVLETNRPIVRVAELAPSSYELVNEGRLSIPLEPALSGKRFYLATQQAAIQLEARVEGARLPFFVGPTHVELEGPVEFWARDPHGVAWLDVGGSGRPELYVSRGALRGTLAPPSDPKFDDFYWATDGPVPFYERVEVPPSYSRGRMAQWVDLEGDGRLELYVASKASPNALLAFDPHWRGARDVAPELGLDFDGADSFAWLDLDGDGDDDLVTLDARAGLAIHASEGGRRFERRDALAPGLRLAPSAGAGEEGVEEEDFLLAAQPEDENGGSASPPGGGAVQGGIEEHELVLLDAENDGDLDVLVSGWGKERACLLFLASETGFVESAQAAGLAQVRGVTDVIVADFDADAFLDLLFLGPQAALFQNRRGRMQPVPLPPDWPGRGARVGAVCDVDRDGRLDVALAGVDLTLARNRTGSSGRWVELTLARSARVPVGAVVRAFHADGAVRTCRVGSTHRGHLSQSHGPIALASPEENPLLRIEVQLGDVRRSVSVAGPGPLHIALD